MHKATRLAALLLVAFAGLLFVLALWLGTRQRAQPAGAPPARLALVSPPKTQQVVVAARDLPAGEVIDSNDLRLAAMASLPPGAHAEPGALAGRILAAPVPAGAVLDDGVLAHGLALELQPGERALAVPVDELAGAGNRIAPGDFVDVFMTLKPSGREQAEGQTRLLLSRLRVLGYGTQDLERAGPRPQQDPASTGNARAGSIAARDGSSAASTQPARSAVLAVPVAQANRLLLAAQGGKLTLALRHPGDTGGPDESLFPRPRNVLSPRLDLSPDHRDAVVSPENDAYAGLDAAALAGRQAAGAGPSVPRTTQHRRSAPPPLEIIRGTQAAALSVQ